MILFYNYKIYIFSEMTKEVKQYFTDNKVCFVTNSISEFPGSLFLHSLKTYIDYIPDNSFICIPGFKNNKPYYGLNAFNEMIFTLIQNQYGYFEYAIYIDEDCFIKDIELLIKEFDKFKSGNYCLAGLQDGGMICHRNQSKFLVNTFLSFWNIKAIRENYDRYTNNLNVFSQIPNPYQIFVNKLKEYKNSELYDIIDNAANNMIQLGKEYREKNFKQEPPHASIVRNDPTNKYEPRQIPYSFKDNVKINMEPYYLIEEAVVFATKMPIYYFFGSDLYTDKETKMDNSGITTVLLNDKNEPYAYHTWFARYYKPFLNDLIIKKHTDRINSIIENI